MRSSRHLLLLARVELGARNAVLDELLRVQVRRRRGRRREVKQRARVAGRVAGVGRVALEEVAEGLDAPGQLGAGHDGVGEVVVELRAPLDPDVQVAPDGRLEVVLEPARAVAAAAARQAAGRRQHRQLAFHRAHLRFTATPHSIL